MRREVRSVFPDGPLEGLLVVPTCQQAERDLVQTGEKIETEKDRLLERVSVLGVLLQVRWRLVSHLSVACTGLLAAPAAGPVPADA
jgi:hypothetical protein